MVKLEAIGAHDLIVMHYIIHIIPFANIFFNVTFSNIKFRYSHVIFTILTTSVFFVINYYAVLHINNGEPFYPFFPWATNFEQSVVNAVGLLIAASLVYIGTCIYINKGLRQVQTMTPKKTN